MNQSGEQLFMVAGKAVGLCAVRGTVHDRKQTEAKRREKKRERLSLQPTVEIWQWTIHLIHSYLVTLALQPIK